MVEQVECCCVPGIVQQRSTGTVSWSRMVDFLCLVTAGCFERIRGACERAPQIQTSGLLARSAAASPVPLAFSSTSLPRFGTPIPRCVNTPRKPRTLGRHDRLNRAGPHGRHSETSSDLTHRKATHRIASQARDVDRVCTVRTSISLSNGKCLLKLRSFFLLSWLRGSSARVAVCHNTKILAADRFRPSFSIFFLKKKRKRELSQLTRVNCLPKKIIRGAISRSLVSRLCSCRKTQHREERAASLPTRSTDFAPFWFFRHRQMHCFTAGRKSVGERETRAL